MASFRVGLVGSGRAYRWEGAAKTSGSLSPQVIDARRGLLTAELTRPRPCAHELPACDKDKTISRHTSTMALDDESPASAHDGGDSNSGKRKSDDPHQQQKQKRNRYISIAWYICSPHLAHKHKHQIDHSKQRMQTTEDQVQWSDPMPAMRQSRSRLRLRSQLLHL